MRSLAAARSPLPRRLSSARTHPRESAHSEKNRSQRSAQPTYTSRAPAVVLVSRWRIRFRLPPVTSDSICPLTAIAPSCLCWAVCKSPTFRSKTYSTKTFNPCSNICSKSTTERVSENSSAFFQFKSRRNSTQFLTRFVYIFLQLCGSS